MGLVREGRERRRGGDSAGQPRGGERRRGVRRHGGGRQQLARQRHVAVQVKSWDW